MLTRYICQSNNIITNLINDDNFILTSNLQYILYKTLSKDIYISILSLWMLVNPIIKPWNAQSGTNDLPLNTQKTQTIPDDLNDIISYNTIWYDIL